MMVVIKAYELVNKQRKEATPVSEFRSVQGIIISL